MSRIALVVGECRHCRETAQLTGRGICCRCYNRETIRAQYPRARRPGHKQLPQEHESLILLYAERASRCEPLFQEGIR